MERSHHRMGAFHGLHLDVHVCTFADVNVKDGTHSTCSTTYIDRNDDVESATLRGRCCRTFKHSELLKYYVVQLSAVLSCTAKIHPADSTLTLVLNCCCTTTPSGASPLGTVYRLVHLSTAPLSGAVESVLVHVLTTRFQSAAPEGDLYHDYVCNFQLHMYVHTCIATMIQFSQFIASPLASISIYVRSCWLRVAHTFACSLQLVLLNCGPLRCADTYVYLTLCSQQTRWVLPH